MLADHYTQLNWIHPKYSTQKIGHEKALGKVVASFVNSETKTESYGNFGALFSHVQAQSKRASTAFRNDWQNIDPSLHARNERTVKQWTSPGLKYCKEGRTYQLEKSWPPFAIRKAPSSPNIWRKKSQSRGSTMLIYWTDSILNWLKKCPHLVKRKTHFSLLTRPKSPQQDGGITVFLTLSSKFGPMRLLFVSKYKKKMVSGKAILVRRQNHRRKKAYFAEFDKSHFSDSLKWLEYCWTKCIELKGDWEINKQNCLMHFLV